MLFHRKNLKHYAMWKMPDTKKPHIVWFCSYEKSRINKSLEWSLTSNRYRVAFGHNEDVQELDSSYAHTTL